jgi:hypothetical protein
VQEAGGKDVPGLEPAGGLVQGDLEEEPRAEAACDLSAEQAEHDGGRVLQELWRADRATTEA